MPNQFTLESSTEGVLDDATHGSRSGGTLHSQATSSSDGFMSAADKAKLDGISPGSGGVLQTKFVEVTTNTTTTNTTWTATLLTQTLTVGAGNSLLVQFAVSSSNGTGNTTNFFRVRLDGVVQRGASSTAQGANNAAGAMIQLRLAGLSAGSHTVSVQWRVSAGTGQVRPVAAPDAESASLVVTEVSV